VSRIVPARSSAMANTILPVMDLNSCFILSPQ